MFDQDVMLDNSILSWFPLFAKIILIIGDNIQYNPNICLFDLIIYVPSTVFQIYRDESSWAEPVLGWD